MDSTGTSKPLKDQISASLIAVTRTAGQIAAEDLAFHRSSDPSIGRKLDRQIGRLLELAKSLSRSATAGTDVAAPSLTDADAVEDNWQGLVDVVDNLLEKADACLDEYTGVIKRLTPSRKSAPTPTTVRKPFPSKQYRTQDIAKPQLLFQKMPNNQDITAFKPLLHTKPHAIVPLHESISPLLSEDGFNEYKHPYEIEIAQSAYPPTTYVKHDPIPYLPYESTTAIFVDTLEGVQAMLEALKMAKEIAVDLEHHDTHSYVGLVCLMQISTREQDWVVDTLKPWREELQILNEVFANPSILKILHGSYMDIIWLQRDLGLYVVGLFDTYYASQSLGYPRHSLASLLAKFANFEAQKQYQMADWRIRPLPQEMFNYARSDTHFLLYIYDNMRNELIERSDPSPGGSNLIDVVLGESKKVASRKYEREFYDLDRGMGATGWYNMLSRTPALFTKEQFAVFRATHQWRDETARKYDESLNYIMSKNAIFNIAREMPTELPALLGCSHPISPFMHRHAEELLAVVRSAKASGATGPDLKDFMKAHSAQYELPPGVIHTSNEQTTARSLQILQASSFLGDKSVTIKRSDSSSFWGSTVTQVEVDYASASRFINQQPRLRLALPLPHFTADIFGGTETENSQDTALSSSEPGSHNEHKYIKDRPVTEDSVFVIKELGGGRNRKGVELIKGKEPAFSNGRDFASGATAHSDETTEVIPSGYGMEWSAQERSEGKAKQKELKRLKKLAERQAKESGRRNEEEAEAPFDYTNAPSVLHAKPGKDAERVMHSAFDPYSKSLNAPKGMRRSTKEVAGKSFTFKS